MKKIHNKTFVTSTIVLFIWKVGLEGLGKIMLLAEIGRWFIA